MKIKLFIVSIVVATTTMGCSSAHKLTMPKGRWQAVNQAGFIPAKAERYYVDNTPKTQENAESATEPSETQAISDSQ